MWAIILSFAVSILFFTLLLKQIVLELGIRPEVLTKVSGIILLVFGVFMLFPDVWQRVMVKTGIEKRIQSSQSKERT